MAANIEIKAHVSDLLALKKKVEDLCGRQENLLIQKDIFYYLKNYRIKLRDVNGSSELIIYKRDNTSGPKACKYLRLPIIFPKLVHFLLGATLGVRGTVKKKRALFFAGKTRIHLDEVDNLGTFLEFEVVLGNNDDPTEGVSTANELMDLLQIKEENLISGAYIDLLEDGNYTT